MNGILAVGIAVLIYPGLLVALIVALILSWGRASARAGVMGAPLPSPLRDFTEVYGALNRDGIVPETAYGLVLNLASTLALVMPLVALVLLPVPGNPLVANIGMRGDLVAEGGLLLGLPLLRLFIGWAIPSPLTRLAADRGARLLAGALAPIVLALVAVGEQFATVQLNFDAASKAPLGNFDLITRLLAGLAFVFALPVLARVTALRDQAASPEAPAGELGEMSGRDLARFRVAEALQLVAVAAFFATAFVLPLFPGVAGAGRTILWIAALVVTTLLLGAWDGFATRLPPSADERPPLSWWTGFPTLLGLLALVAAAWASRGF
jgi:formate hydrogenlyase subunit 4